MIEGWWTDRMKVLFTRLRILTVVSKAMALDSVGQMVVWKVNDSEMTSALLICY